MARRTVAEKRLDQLDEIIKWSTFFPEMDANLLKLAITPRNGTLDDGTYRYLKEKYQIGEPNYQLLEFYGDQVLSLIVIDEMMNMSNLKLTPGDATTIKANLVKNLTLTQISRELGICQIVWNIPPTAELEKHNSCGDSIESIIGAFYVFLGIRNLERIKEWFFSLPPTRRLIDQEITRYIPVQNPILREWSYDLGKTPNQNLDDFLDTYQRKYPNFGKINVGYQNGSFVLKLDGLILIDAVDEEDYIQNIEKYSEIAFEILRNEHYLY